MPVAPVYRYYTVDLLTNETLEEIPFGGVNWSRSLQSAGSFSGSIPVIDSTEHLSLYESTMPGKTALYIVRNGVCVWGGIIWSREYDIVNKNLSVAALEFTSYLYHRRIWKTWSHQFGATVVFEPGSGHVVFDYGSSTPVIAGSTIEIEFYDPKDFKYNGFYRVSGSPAPNVTGFDIVDGVARADLSTVEVTDGVAYVTTVAQHGFHTGDLITVDSEFGPPFDGTFEITVPPGANTNLFSFPVTGADITRTSVTGSATRPVPEGVYSKATITLRSDTYDYVRNLINSMSKDFVGKQFPNVYIEPGISYGVNVTHKRIDAGLAFIETETPHNLSEGQAVQIQDVGSPFDGEFEVLRVLSSTEFMYETGGSLVSSPVAPVAAVITKVALAAQTVTITTSAAHGFVVGNHVDIFIGYDYSDLNGSQVVSNVLSPTVFQYEVYSTQSFPERTLVNATATVGASVRGVTAATINGSVATLTTSSDHGFNVGDSVTIANVNRTVLATEKSLDAANSVATVRTNQPHGFQVGQTITLNGLRDMSTVTKRRNTSSTVTFTTAQAHNFKVGDSIVIENMVDDYRVSNKQISGNVVTLTMAYPHNLGSGSSITVSGITDSYTITNKNLTDGVATITTSINHNVSVNDKIVVSGLSDTASVVAVEAENNIATLTLSGPHNFLVDQEINVAGVGAQYNGTRTVLSTTKTRILFEISNGNAVIKPTVAGGTVSTSNSYFNGEYTVSAVTSNTISYSRAGNDVATHSSSGSVSYDSVMNGVFTTTGVTSTTVTYAITANNYPSTAIPEPNGDDQIKATASRLSIYNGTNSVTAVTRNTVSFAKVLVADDVDRDASGTLSVQSIFNGTRTITSVTADSFKFALSALNNQFENEASYIATVTATNIFNGTYTITAVDPDNRTFSFAKTWGNIALSPIQSYGEATVYPVAIISTFGPYPGNADIGLTFSTRLNSGVNVEPIAYRGFELKSVGDALDTYADSIDGFEYRIDCAFDEETEKFSRTFVIVPINFPNPPPEGEVSPLSRFGADRLVFEYPGGSIVSLSVMESAEDSATRFFASGETDLGADVGPNISIASAEDLLSGSNGVDTYRRWPLLDAEEKVDGVDDENVLYAYAKRYLSESRPPDAQFNIEVNGSIDPVVGTYSPGDWCALIINDPFILDRLKSKLEPRDTVIVRKIDGFKVTVPDGTAFPEKVTLNLVPEWEVDKRGESAV